MYCGGVIVKMVRKDLFNIHFEAGAKRSCFWMGFDDEIWEKRVYDNSTVFGLSNWPTEALWTEMGKT